MAEFVFRGLGRRLGVVSVILCIFCAMLIGDPTFDGGTQWATISPRNNEYSGIGFSRTNPGVFWVHADSGDGPDVYAHRFDGQYIGICHLDGATFTDAEDMGIGPGPVTGVNYLYVGDIGDNGASRNSGVDIYRFPEPEMYTRWSSSPRSWNISSSAWQRTRVTYPGVIFFREEDAETMMIDPRNGDLIIAQKLNDHIPVFRAAASSLFQGSTVGLTKIADISTPGWKATGGDIQAQATELIIRGYSGSSPYTNCRIWKILSGQSIQDALAGTAYGVPLHSEPQGEAIGFERSGSGYGTVSEGNPTYLYYFTRTSNDAPTPLSTVIGPEAQWKYLDNGTDQGTAWRSLGFNDSSWNSGLAQLGYGEGDEQTTVSYGGNPANKFVTTYFRKTVCVDTSVPFETLNLRMIYEGGVAVYLNGTEVLRTALASGAGFSTLASGTRGVTKYAWLTQSVTPALMLDGENTIAVEVHLASVSQADLSFDFQLEGTRNAGYTPTPVCGTPTATPTTPPTPTPVPTSTMTPTATPTATPTTPPTSTPVPTSTMTPTATPTATPTTPPTSTVPTSTMTPTATPTVPPPLITDLDRDKHL